MRDNEEPTDVTDILYGCGIFVMLGILAIGAIIWAIS